MVKFTSKLFAALLLVALLLSPVTPARAAGVADVVTPGLCIVKTDMQIPWMGSLFVNYHSRTRLKLFRFIPGHMTPATIRLQGGRGNVPLPQPWRDYLGLVNNNNAQFIKYVNHFDSGWVNAQLWTAEQIVFESQYVFVERVSGNKAYVKTYHVDEAPPATVDLSDPRIQYFTIVTREDRIIFAPPGKLRAFLIARAG